MYNRRTSSADPDVPEKPPGREALLAYAFRALGQRALTAHELRTRLARRTTDEADIEATVQRVRDLGYLDDAQVAQIVSARRGVGRHRVQAELRRRGVDDDAARSALETLDPDHERAQIVALLERHAAKFRRARDPQSSAFAFLARRGFASGLIWSALRETGLGNASQEPEDEFPTD